MPKPQRSLSLNSRSTSLNLRRPPIPRNPPRNNRRPLPRHIHTPTRPDAPRGKRNLDSRPPRRRSAAIIAPAAAAALHLDLVPVREPREVVCQTRGWRCDVRVLRRGRFERGRRVVAVEAGREEGWGADDVHGAGLREGAFCVDGGGALEACGFDARKGAAGVGFVVCGGGGRD